ncbi:tyrosine-type recombinase/integrase [Streptomyces sp. Edi2]|uniref:tyrosine-type recombinase/integrase n=1 Tax=Streptomyces sp. Edi2 TaxID=3162528 RepID=UPI0033066792
MSRHFKRLVELSGLPPVRLHGLRRISASLSLLAGTDIKVVQERLGHSSRQITSDTYTSVVPEMMRTEAESIASVVPRIVVYDVHRELEIPEGAFHDSVVIVFTRCWRDDAGTWTVEARTAPETPALGQISTPGGSQDQATFAALQWIREHCADRGWDGMRIENLSDHYPEELRPFNALLRFTIVRPEEPDVAKWCPLSAPSDGHTGSTRPRAGGRPKRSKKAV